MRRKTLFFMASLLVFLLLAFPSLADLKENTKNQSFAKAKKVLLEKVYYDHHKTFYCDCDFSSDKTVSHANGYKPKNTWKRAYRIEWEHIVPAYEFGHNFPEWTNGSSECVSSKGKPYKGRKCAEKVQSKYRYMQADTYNLVPAVGEVNGLRSNYPYGIIPGEKREFGTCDMEIENKRAEPPPEKRGDIARTYFYMEYAYPAYVKISEGQRKMFKEWSEGDLVDQWECERSQRIEALQGSANPLVNSKCGQ